MTKFKAFFLILVVSSSAVSQELYSGVNGKRVTLDNALSSIKPGTIVILGEHHGQDAIGLGQLEILNKISNYNKLVSVGMEFFDYTQQSLVDQFREGLLVEEEFLKQIRWGQGFPFSAYRSQVLFPTEGRGVVLGLNSPRALSSRVSKCGLLCLTEEEKALFPPDFTRGNASYFERFDRAMGGHVPADKLENYFLAQSLWDDTMAWKAAEFIKNNPDQILVIIVGEFHVQYGGGLPDRIKARGVHSLLTFSMINVSGSSDEEKLNEILPSPEFGQRSDFVWLYEL